MANKKNEDIFKFPALGRRLTWVDRPGSANRLIIALMAVCILLAFSDFFYEKHGHYDVEHWFNFYGFFGFVSFTFIVLAAKALRELIKRPEDYYGNKAVDREEWPERELERKEHDNA